MSGGDGQLPILRQGDAPQGARARGARFSYVLYHHSYDDADLSDHYRECPKIDVKCPIYLASLKLPIPLCSCSGKYKREDAAAHHSTSAHEHAQTERLHFEEAHTARSFEDATTTWKIPGKGQRQRQGRDVI